MKALQGAGRFNIDALSSWFSNTKISNNKPTHNLRKIEIEDSLDPLFDYLNENFATLARGLTPDLKIKVMTQTWNVVLETIDHLLLPPLSDRRTIRQQLNATEVEIVFTWLSAMKSFFYHDGAGPSLEILQSQKYQQLIDTTIFYNWTTTQLKQESEKMLSQSFKSLKDKNYFASPEILMKRKNTVMAHRNRTVVKKQNEQLRIAQRETPQTEDIILRILKTRGEHDYVSRRLKQREKVAQALASESIANSGFR
ncbi:hypothetical protein AWJ20_1791 [Sugiyamaella lignohabitans]|uniref:MHD2 domain-containing protein n=1 Tax=Sugiyamaella lignohabitans TaxID=796027 RepID=A0A161HKH2_9ASCO|nr:uncharacterized protein AWJ20_1791 [Sugiyamaella lignohabitans]ANB13497.1 hypothetical protein AWJ20_1791 [Sugiyamaella lignohabitans]